MNNFDFDLYDDEEPKKPDIITPQKPAEGTKKSSFDFDLYDDEESSKPPKNEIYEKFYKPKEYSDEEIKKMSPQDRYQYFQDLEFGNDYLKSGAFSKNAISSFTSGFSERIPELKPQEGEQEGGSAILGKMVGDVAPFGLGFKLMGKALKLLPQTYKWSKRALGVTGAFGVGAGIEGGHQYGAEEEFDPGKILMAGSTVSLLHSLFQSTPTVYRWFKNLSETNKEAVLNKNLIPENLSPSDYKFYENEVVPELQKMAESEYKNAYEAAKQENDLMFKQEMQNIKAAHENELFKIKQTESKYEGEYESAKQQNDLTYNQEMANVRAAHENELYKIKQAEAEYAARAKEIEESNQAILKEFEAGKKEWEATKTREKVVREAIDSSSREAEINRQFKPTEGEDTGIRPEAPFPAKENLNNKIGNIISPKEFPNTTVAGEEVTAAIRGSASADREGVRELYKVSDELNKGVKSSHPDLASKLTKIISDLEGKDLTPNQQTILKNAKSTIDNLIVFDEEGTALGLKEVDNLFILDQAKALREKMYYDFSEGNPTGEFTPLVELYQDAAKQASVAVGNEAATAANNAARSAHSEWMRLYQNPYIRQWRNLNVNKPMSLYNNGLTIDNFRNVNRVLSRSNSGQNLSVQMRRDLVNKKLEKFYKDPRKASMEDFNKTLNELEPILEPGERSKISNEFRQSRKTSYIPAKKIESLPEPKEPKLQKVPEKTFQQPSHVKIPKKPQVTKKTVQQPSVVKVPTKPEVKPTPEMREASKMMKIEPEDAMKMADTPSGIKKLRSKLEGTEKGERLFDEISKRKIKDILYGGNVKKTYSGDELFRLVNKQENFDILTEIIGEARAKEYLDAAQKIGKDNMTRETVLKVTKNVALVKYLHGLGFF